MALTKRQVTELQRALNQFTSERLRGVNDLRVDGDLGPATKQRIEKAKWYLGFRAPNDAKIDNFGRFLKRLAHPKRESLFPRPRLVARGIRRRAAQRRRYRREKNSPASGVGRFDNVPVANWLIPYLQWARNHGWDGRLVSGWRDPVYSEQLCYRMCGAPSCPGRCAGRASNHSGSVKPAGAVDVSYYYQFGQIIRNCPYSPRIYNALGPADPVHFSASGR